MTIQESPYRLDSFLRGIRSLLASLPSEEEKRQLIQTLKDTPGFHAGLTSSN